MYRHLPDPEPDHYWVKNASVKTWQQYPSPFAATAQEKTCKEGGEKASVGMETQSLNPLEAGFKSQKNLINERFCGCFVLQG